MSTKRTLTAEEAAAAARLKRAVKASPLTQEAIGAKLGVGQAMIWQWANARLPVPAHRAQALAAVLDIDDAGTISAEFRQIAPATSSQGLDVDVDKLTTALRIARKELRRYGAAKPADNMVAGGAAFLYVVLRKGVSEEDAARMVAEQLRGIAQRGNQVKAEAKNGDRRGSSK